MMRRKIKIPTLKLQVVLAGLLLFTSCVSLPHPAKVKAKYGFESDKGEMVIKPRFQSAAEFVNGFSIVGVDTTLPDSHFVDPMFGYDGYWERYNEVYHLFTFVNPKGKRFQNLFVEVRNFSNGMAAVRTKDGWGFIDTKGNLIIDCQYDKVTDFDHGKSQVAKTGGENWWFEPVINKKGKVITEDLKGRRKPDWFDSVSDYKILMGAADLYERLMDYSSSKAHYIALMRRFDNIRRVDTLSAMKIATKCAYFSVLSIEDESQYEYYRLIAKDMFEIASFGKTPRDRDVMLVYLAMLVDVLRVREINMQKTQEKATLIEILNAVKQSGTEDIRNYWDVEERLKNWKD